MKFLILHNRYSARGGEDRVAELQAELLAAAGHTVVRYERSYDELKKWRFGRLTSFFSAFYNRKSVREVKALVARDKPDVALVHNVFPVISPAVLPLLRDAGVRVVLVVHNYRLSCPTGLAFRNGKACEECPKRGMFQCVAHRCQGSLLGSAAFALRSIWARPIFRKNIDLYSPVSHYVCQQLVGWGSLPVAQAVVCGNPVRVPQTVRGIEGRSGVLFVGRFTADKGAAMVLELARQLPEVPFTVTADPQAAPKNVRFVGVVDRVELDLLYSMALVVVSPSGVAETFGLAAAEGMAAGAVAVVSDRGALPELVADGAGICVAADDTHGWVEAIRSLTQDGLLWQQYAQKGRQRIVERYAADGYADRLYRQIELVAQDQ